MLFKLYDYLISCQSCGVILFLLWMYCVGVNSKDSYLSGLIDTVCKRMHQGFFSKKNYACCVLISLVFYVYSHISICIW